MERPVDHNEFTFTKCHTGTLYKKFQHQTLVRLHFCENYKFYFGASDQCDVNKVCSCNVPKSAESAKISQSFLSYWLLKSQIQLLQLQDDSIELKRIMIAITEQMPLMDTCSNT